MRGNLYSDIPDCDFHVEGRVGNSLVFCKQKSDLLVKKRELLTLLFYHERREQIAQGHSFVKSKARPKIRTRDGQI